MWYALGFLGEMLYTMYSHAPRLTSPRRSISSQTLAQGWVLGALLLFGCYPTPDVDDSALPVAKQRTWNSEPGFGLLVVRPRVENPFLPLRTNDPLSKLTRRWKEQIGSKNLVDAHNIRAAALKKRLCQQSRELQSWSALVPWIILSAPESRGLVQKTIDVLQRDGCAEETSTWGGAQRIDGPRAMMWIHTSRAGDPAPTLDLIFGRGTKLSVLDQTSSIDQAWEEIRIAAFISRLISDPKQFEFNPGLESISPLVQKNGFTTIKLTEWTRWLASLLSEASAGLRAHEYLLKKVEARAPEPENYGTLSQDVSWKIYWSVRALESVHDRIGETLSVHEPSKALRYRSIELRTKAETDTRAHTDDHRAVRVLTVFGTVGTLFFRRMSIPGSAMMNPDGVSGTRAQLERRFGRATELAPGTIGVFEGRYANQHSRGVLHRQDFVAEGCQGPRGHLISDYHVR